MSKPFKTAASFSYALLGIFLVAFVIFFVLALRRPKQGGVGTAFGLRKTTARLVSDLPATRFA